MNNLNIENIDTKQIIEKLNTMLKPKRLEHSINVAKCAIKLSEIYGYDKEKAYLAGLVHDCAKYFTIAPAIITANIIDIHIISIVCFSFTGSLSTIII